jgi:DNA-directed RNA polymerase specialized sigma subunit
METAAELHALIDSLEDDKLKIIMRKRYFGGENGKLKPWKTIAEEIGFSIQGTINLHDATLKKLRKRISHEL